MGALFKDNFKPNQSRNLRRILGNDHFLIILKLDWGNFPLGVSSNRTRSPNRTSSV
jgi:hypothetical protein